MLRLGKYSIGVGDRFAHQAKAQLCACMRAAERELEVTPVWNKSNREHSIIGSEPTGVRAAADDAVRQLGWNRPYHVDADHINRDTVERFLEPSDFFTIDVADFIGRPAPSTDRDAFVARHPELLGRLPIAGLEEDLGITRESIASVAVQYLAAVQEAGRIYRHIEARKGAGAFIAEVSMDETGSPQTPPELLIILAAIADERIPVQTIAPKFTGRFNKGVDYVGDVRQFARELERDVAVIAHAVRRYELPGNLKLSVHSGSDKFSIYPSIRCALRKFDAGVHLKTAGTTWLAELIGLAEGGGEGLALAKEVYTQAYAHREALCEPYTAVIDIDFARLPPPRVVESWSAEEYAGAVRHDLASPCYDRNVRQLLHVGYKIAAKMGGRYLHLLVECEPSITRNVTGNLWRNHIEPVFLG